jgi:effector-binding domain-containing protein
MPYAVESKYVEAQPLAVLKGRATPANLPARIRALFDELYAGLKERGGLNIVFYPGTGGPGEFDIECGVQMQSGGNSSTPAGLVATTTYFGPYDQMRPAHQAIHQWARDNGRTLAGPSWEVYGHWTEDSAKLRTDIFYLLAG